jgi:hypothetical protein
LIAEAQVIIDSLSWQRFEKENPAQDWGSCFKGSPVLTGYRPLDNAQCPEILQQGITIL